MQFAKVFFLIIFLILNITIYAEQEDISKIKKIKICEDIGEWPPYAFLEISNGKKSDKIAGYAVDIIDYILNKNNISYSLEMLPWQRCLAEVKNYNDDYVMVLEFTKNDDREKDYIFTTPFYYTRSAIFYAKTKHKDGLKIKNLIDLKKYSGCGLAGYNYKDYGFNEKELDQGANSIDQVAIKLKADRCDYFIEKYEVVAGFEKVGSLKVISDPEIGYSFLSIVPSTPFYMGISKKYPYAKTLQKLLNKELNLMHKNGILKKMEKKWIEG